MILSIQKWLLRTLLTSMFKDVPERSTNLVATFQMINTIIHTHPYNIKWNTDELTITDYINGEYETAQHYPIDLNTKHK